MIPKWFYDRYIIDGFMCFAWLMALFGVMFTIHMADEVLKFGNGFIRCDEKDKQRFREFYEPLNWIIHDWVRIGYICLASLLLTQVMLGQFFPHVFKVLHHAPRSLLMGAVLYALNVLIFYRMSLPKYRKKIELAASIVGDDERFRLMIQERALGKSRIIDPLAKAALRAT